MRISINPNRCHSLIDTLKIDTRIVKYFLLIFLLILLSVISFVMIVGHLSFRLNVIYLVIWEDSRNFKLSLRSRFRYV